jgi:hypothetical protein
MVGPGGERDERVLGARAAHALPRLVALAGAVAAARRTDRVGDAATPVELAEGRRAALRVCVAAEVARPAAGERQRQRDEPRDADERGRASQKEPPRASPPGTTVRVAARARWRTHA